MNSNWNKKIFSLLLDQAKGVRSWRQFAADCDISYVQIRKLSQGTQENPPRPKLINKIAKNSFGEIDSEDLMFAAGINKGENRRVRESQKMPNESFYDKYRSLSNKDRKTVNEFIGFLLEKSKHAESKDDKQRD